MTIITAFTTQTKHTRKFIVSSQYQTIILCQEYAPFQPGNFRSSHHSQHPRRYTSHGFRPKVGSEGIHAR